MNVHGFDLIVFVAFELAGSDEILARVFPLNLGSLFLAVVHFVSLGPFGPWVIRCALFGRLRHDLELRHTLATVTE